MSWGGDVISPGFLRCPICHVLLRSFAGFGVLTTKLCAEGVVFPQEMNRTVRAQKTTGATK
eukprot:3077526-Amphidinium_carterae.1